MSIGVALYIASQLLAGGVCAAFCYRLRRRGDLWRNAAISAGINATTRSSRIAELEDDLAEREDESALALAMGAELAKDASGETGQSPQWQACARYYLTRYREVLAAEDVEAVDG